VSAARPTLDLVTAVTAPRTRSGWLPVPAEAGVLPRWARWALLVNLVAEVGIVVTGGLVRLTGSGLGCPTWPECVPGSYTPVVQQPQGIHKYIEFGNRTLTGVVGLAALVALVAVVLVVRRQRRPRRLLALGAAPLLGVIAQAVLGGITVRTHLHPATVAAHFLVSAVVIALSTVLLRRMAEPDGRPVPRVAREGRWLAWGLVAATAVVLVLGTVVTGSGPHSGDAEAPARFGLDPQAMSWLHADAVLVWFGLLAALLLALRLTDAPAPARRAGVVVLVVGLGQGLVGYLQYLTGLPVVAVAVHMLGACLLVVSVTWFVLALRERSAVVR
jgi:cytochrome c oxidase assembly protein subunit 15